MNKVCYGHEGPVSLAAALSDGGGRARVEIAKDRERGVARMVGIPFERDGRIDL